MELHAQVQNLATAEDGVNADNIDLKSISI